MIPGVPFEYTGARLYQYFLTQTSRFLRPPALFLSCPSAMLRLSVPSFVCCGCFIYTSRGVRERVYVQGQVRTLSCMSRSVRASLRQ